MKKQIRDFILWTYISTGLLWGSIAVANQFGALMYGTTFCMVLFFFGGWAPTVAGILCQRKYGQWFGFKAFFKECFEFKQKPIYYVLVFGLIAFYYIDLTLLGCTKPVGPWYFWIISLPITITFGGFEEHGWRQVLQPALEEHMAFWRASLITGVLWAFWHLPLYMMIGYERIENFPAFAIDTIGFSFALAAVKHTSKSIWLCILLHALLNAGTRVLDIQETLAAGVVQMAVWIVLSLVIVEISDRKREYISLSETEIDM